MKRKRSLAMLLGCVLALHLTGCGGSGETGPADGDHAAEPAAPEETETAAVTIAENTVLLDRDGLVITAKALEEDKIWGLGVKVLVENNSQRNLSVSCSSLAVNNYMVGSLFSTSVAAGKKANETIELSSSDLEAAGITTVAEMVFDFRVSDSDSYDTLFSSGEITLPTSAFGTVEQPAMDEGRELLNQDGIRIVGRYVDEDSFWGKGILLFMENTTDRNVGISCDDLSVNGFMLTPFFSCRVNSGRMALDDVTLMSSELEENGIDTVEDVELKFRVYDADTYDTVLETDAITFTVE